MATLTGWHAAHGCSHATVISWDPVVQKVEDVYCLTFKEKSSGFSWEHPAFINVYLDLVLKYIALHYSFTKPTLH